jgi:hypothetical protein
MWEKTTEEVVLTKGEKGLGFSILDYQVKCPQNSFSIMKYKLIKNLLFKLPTELEL